MNGPTPPARRFLLPDLGEGLTDAELVRWQVAVGEYISLNQNLCEVETAKALVELPSPFAGEVVALLAAEGDTVLVGDPLIEIAAAAPTSPDTAQPVAARPDATEPSAPEPDSSEPDSAAAGAPPAASDTGILVGTGPLAHRPSRIRRADYATAPPSPAGGAPARAAAQPAARKLARELGLDLRMVAGSGAAGVITAADVQAARDLTAHRETRTPARGVRKAMAESVTLSARTIPQVTVFLTVDVTAAMRMLAGLREDPAFHGLALTPLSLTALSLLAALRAHPELNSSWDEDTGEVIARNHVNLGIAVASPRGLVVPHVKDAQRLRLAELTQAIGAVADAARSGTSSPADLTGGTISITNVGVFGVDSGTPILPPGEAAILCLGTVAQRPWVHRGGLAVREVVTLALTFDHRLADGQQASLFLAAVGAGLENPLRLLA